MKANLDVDAPSKTGLVHEPPGGKKRQVCWGTASLICLIGHVLLDSLQAALADCFRLVVTPNLSGRKILPTKSFEKGLAT